MRLDDIFLENKYINILEENNEFKDCYDVSFFFDDNERIPDELIALYVSQHRDEIFVVLDSKNKDINELCSLWDEKISIFMMFGSHDRELLKKMKYNAIQVIVYDKKIIINKSQEASLNVSRKIILPCDFDDQNKPHLVEGEELELPFVIIPSTKLKVNNNEINKLKQLLPLNDELKFLYEYREKKYRRQNDNIKNFNENEFELVKEWIEKNENKEC